MIFQLKILGEGLNEVKETFGKIFTALANKWFLFYNGEDGFQKVATGSDGQFIVENQVLFSLFHQNENK